ncbi:siderophore ABC transporter substrate-binding protein [Paenibacillus harenae]|uniref:siderophore ABC transporter substrate-binding protein n=1 Tax=Paenibacillus harenae TaxID=306543 RepID=UPI002790D65A|nr:siderophore ABC transporter substrate-binding protein [Paenibacillus harenae]MDQ0063604.1 iron complex transport system substrate-binding protein [Paenibacillus harenae]
MKKSFVLIILTVMLASVLSACGASNANKSGGATTAQAEAATNAPTVAPTEAPSAPAEMTIKHELGTATVKTNPAKVVVFDYGVLDTLDKLGIEVAAVPQESLPEYLAKYKDGKYENAGTLFEPDFEKLNALKPDVIFIGGRTSEAYGELNKIAPTILMSVDYANYEQSFAANLTIIGQAFGEDTEAAKELAAIQAASADLNAKAANAGKTLILLTTGGKMSAFGPGSRFGVIHDVFGFVPADAAIESDTHGQSVSNEYVLEKNPDILFVVDRDAVAGGEGAQPAKQVIENDLIKQTNAFKNNKIFYLDPGYWYLSGGGLISGTEMINEAAKAVE